MKLKIELSRQGNLILAILLIHFGFFGYICNIFEKAAGERLLYLHKILFDPDVFLAPFFLFAIVFFMVFREKFFEYGIRNSIWLTPIIIGQSWIWMWFIIGFDITIIGEFFTHLDGYITIFSILGLNLLSGILGAITRQKYEQYLQEIKKI